MFHVEGLVKRFGPLVAVDGVSFETRRGEIYGLLGPNGAGKTTTLSMLAGLLRPDEGRIEFDGIDLAAEPLRVKARLGVVPQENALYDNLTAVEHLRFWTELYRLRGADRDRAVDRALDVVGLAARGRDKVSTYSGGMKRRLNLALGLVHGPSAVLMDEPTVGIDPQARANILDVVRSVAASGTTVVYTTHYLEEAETLCDRIGIVDHGRLLAEGNLAELKLRAGEADVVTVEGTFDPAVARERVEGVDGARVLAVEPGRLILASGDGRRSVAVLSRLLGGDLPISSVEIRPPSLEGLFLKLTGRELRD